MDLDATQAASLPGALRRQADARPAVTALYQAHALGLIRLAVVMLGDRPAAEDVVQEAFCGLYQRWDRLADSGNALAYVRSSVLNGCRTVLRHRSRRQAMTGAAGGPETAESAETTALLEEEHREILAALRRLPDRQREALVLRYYAELAGPEIAQAMGVSAGTVKSTVSRALTALGRLLQEGR